jgi:acetylornithine deacetylase/succinyl-diaminopimelate desuccinylase-like protein
MASYLSYLSDHSDQYLAELLEFLRIPSISSLPEHKEDVQNAAQWVSNRLIRAGIENVSVMPTGGHPVVYGDWLHADGKPTIMIYGHFDTQPVDPLELWSNPPFEPVVKEDRVYARGATDDKGNMLAAILAVEALLSTQKVLPVNVKFLFEGQEEIGSPQLSEFIPAHSDQLACDLILSADGGQWSEDQPALHLGLRGLCALQIDVQGAAHDVHSGVYGGTFLNPIHALVMIINSMRSPRGLILIDGFFDAVRQLSEIEKQQIAEVPFDDTAYKKELGVTEFSGEPGYSTFERAWVRPTLDVNGIWGGFQGAGLKTVIPGMAHAKISCRLVPDQEPEKIYQLICTHIKKHTPPGVKAEITKIPGQAEPYLIPHDHPGNQAALDVHKALFGKEPHYVRMGGSIPICGILKKALGAYTVSFGFGLMDENIHAPDEFFRLKSFERAQKAYCMLLNRLEDYKI